MKTSRLVSISFVLQERPFVVKSRLKKKIIMTKKREPDAEQTLPVRYQAEGDVLNCTGCEKGRHV